MDKNKAKQARNLLNELDKFKEKLNWLTENNRKLYFGVENNDKIMLDLIGKFDLFSSMLERHKEMMINEIEKAISDIEKDIEQL